MNEPIIEVQNLTKKFADVVAVNDISFSVEKGEIFGIIGANGAGKTTTIRILCGLIPPSAGRARVAGYDVAEERDRVKGIIGYMSQKFSLYEDLKAIENLEFFASLYNVRKREFARKVKSLSEFLDLGSFLNATTSSLPLGWKQRLALACALIHDPEIIFLDEPTSGVDPVSRRNFWRAIKKLSSEGKTIIVTTHYLEEAEYCHRLAIMHEGKIVALESPSTLKEKFGKRTIQEVFIAIMGRSGNEV